MKYRLDRPFVVNSIKPEVVSMTSKSCRSLKSNSTSHFKLIIKSNPAHEATLIINAYQHIKSVTINDRSDIYINTS